MSFKKTIKKKAVQKLKGRRSISDRQDSDPARGRSGGKHHTSRAAGTTHGQSVGRYSSQGKRSYKNQDARMLQALKEIRASHKCSDPTAERNALQHGYARRVGQGLTLTPKGTEYIRYGKDY